jgi:DNA polymerase-3 subunit gamma/tau
VTDWVVTAIPGAVAAPASIPSPDSPPSPAEPAGAEPEPGELEPAAPRVAVPHPADATGRQRYGEAVVREVLGATFLVEETIVPLVSAEPVDLFAEPAAAAVPHDPDRPSSADAPDPLRDEY